MAELTKEDLCSILEVALLNFENVELYKCLNYKLSPKQVIMGRKVLEFVKGEWL